MVNLSKVELTKKGQSINLTKSNTQSIGEILVNLNWNQQTKNSGGFFSALFGKGNAGVDLDLGCLYELKNGEKGCVQALGNSFGSFRGVPYMELDGDDRTGAVSGGENLRINGNKIQDIKRVLVYSFIYEGVANWSQADGIVTIKYPSGPDIEVKLDEHRNGKIMCAIAMIENVKNETFKVQRLVEYFNGHQDMDRAYGWGMKWVAGRK
ncbi:Tellurium resistance [Heyndrickxia shackletonii]|uniref:Tellurium resistance n=1 Tax=Heyndrickxia shackletonii TaxID=157838 RepID=A0A0Q3WYD7_9BACI|nr:Tellurium resistance [Heyndrickxia shackletonii]MBB2483414.1 Tellurium resistance [Bacillus sp. APMAM]NEY99305.1 Tellurium resistance [Heyndrickxia shackletonii]RTZ53162.1 Tellurium resistance [Bacillus sp. SAJ1]